MRVLSAMTMFGFGEAQAAARPDERTSAPDTVECEVVELFQDLRVPVLRYLVSRNVPVSDAEEIVQDVFLLLFQQLKLGKSAANPAGWVFRAAHLFALKHYERARRQAERFAGSGSAESVPDMADRQDTAMEQAQRQDGLMAVVRALPEQDQQCLHLRAEGLRLREIAEVLGISLGAVCHSLQRSIARITRAESTSRRYAR